MADLVVVSPGSRVLLTQKLDILLMSDSLFMAKTAFQGKVITVTGDIDAVNDNIEYVVPTDKTFYFHSAKIVITGHTIPAATTTTSTVTTKNAIEAVLKIDGVVKDTTNIGIISVSKGVDFTGRTLSGNAYGTIGDGRFDVNGRLLVGNGTKKVEIVNTVDNGSATATLIGWIEDNDDDPSI